MKKNGEKRGYNMLWVLIMLFLIFGVPFVINLAYTTPAVHPMFVMDWSGADALAYYGALIGAFATIYVLRRTIRFTIENQKEERILSIKPYLHSYSRQITLRVDPMLSDVTWVVEVTESQLYSVTHRYNPTELEDSFENYIFILYELENAGANSAVNLQFLLNGRKCVPNFCIASDSRKKFLFVIKKSLVRKEKTGFPMSISIGYSDICSYQWYEQNESFSIHVTSNYEGAYVQCAEGFLTEPHVVEKDKKEKEKGGQD